MADLTTVALVKQHQDIAGIDDDAFIGTLVQDASAMIESLCKRTLVQAPGTLVFDAAPPYVYGRKLFFHEDVASITALIDESGTLDPSHYRLLPSSGTPKYAAELKSGHSWTLAEREEAITVIGVIGAYPEDNIPHDLRRAATRLAQWMYITRDSSGDTVRFASGDMVIPTNAPQDVMTILERGRYIKDRLGV